MNHADNPQTTFDPQPDDSPGCVSVVDHDRNIPDADLLSPLTLRGVTLPNRVVMSPMCQYIAVDGLADDWHLVHLGSRAVGGAGLVMAEATAVTADGRITAGCLGLWEERQIEPLARIARFIDKQGAVPAIQLAHAGRKASSDLPWNGGASLKSPEAGGWPVVGPSALPFDEGDPVPRMLDDGGIEEVVRAFKAAALRAVEAGFRVIEIHSAHGYLLHSFLSPLSNLRTDRYGGDLEGRSRALLRVVSEVRGAVPREMPLFVRISATDWVEGGWDLEQSVELSRTLCALGVDLIDVSTGGLVPKAKIPVGRGYQVPFAAAIRQRAGARTGAVGLITEPAEANEFITSGAADLIFIGRELLRDPYWAVHARDVLGHEPGWPVPYGYAVRRRTRPAS